jgi:hypothetical protein
VFEPGGGQLVQHRVGVRQRPAAVADPGVHARERPEQLGLLQQPRRGPRREPEQQRDLIGDVPAITEVGVLQGQRGQLQALLGLQLSDGLVQALDALGALGVPGAQVGGRRQLGHLANVSVFELAVKALEQHCGDSPNKWGSGALARSLMM